MPILNDTLVDGVLVSRDGYEITNKRYNLANVDEDKKLHISCDDLDMDVAAKLLDISANNAISISSNNTIAISANNDISITSLNKNINLNSPSVVTISAKRFVLNNKDFIYGTTDPNEVVLPNLSEGTLYFRLLRD